MTAATPITLGLAFVPTLPPESLPDLARDCDRYLDELWVWEDCFKQSGIASVATALAVTEKLTVGLGLMPAPLRNVALTAMEIATLHRLFPGRFIPGIGHGVQSWMGQVGGRVASPLTLLEEYADTLRRLLAGERVTVAGRYITLDDVQLDWPPPGGLPLFIGGEGPKTLDLAARAGDGVILSAALSPASLTAARDRVAVQVARRDRTAPLPIVHNLIVATGPGAQERAHRELDLWGASPEPGRYAVGDAAAVAEVIADLGELGASTVVIQPTRDEPDLAGLIRFVGEDVRAHLTNRTS